MNNTNEISSVYDAFNIFKSRFLKEKKSIFTETNELIFTVENINIIVDKFINKPILGVDEKFDEKIAKQFDGVSPQIKELFAHCVWLWSTFANDMSQAGKIAAIKLMVPDWTNTNGVIPKIGIGSTGQYHKTNKHAEISYIVEFLRNYLIDIEKSDTPADISTLSIQIIIELGDTYESDGSSRKVAMYNILLHLFEPKEYERIASFGHKEKIISFFESVFPNLIFNKDDSIDDKLSNIRTTCEEDERFKTNQLDYGIGERFDFYHEDIESYWKSDIVLESKNMILHGAPGTGKTYGVENSIKNRLELMDDQDSNRQFKLVQFHPSYGYEDFIDGIKPDGVDENGSLKFKLVNGEFKRLCIEAFNELAMASLHNKSSARNDRITPKKFYFVADEINRAELSRVFGELLLCIEEDKRLRFSDGKLLGTKVKTQNSNLWSNEHAVVVLNDDGNLDSAGKNYYFGVPENIYFIGTMNDIDRSVDSFDMALRRRFFWKHYECNYDVIRDKFSKLVNNDQLDRVDQYVEICKKLNSQIESEKGFNLGQSYQLGHSYFLKPNAINDKQLSKVWDNNIAPLLKEYLRTDYKENEIKQHLDAAKKIFSLKSFK